MSRKITASNLLAIDAEKHLYEIGDFYIWKNVEEEAPPPPMLTIKGNIYYRFMNFLYLPQPPESLSTEKIIEICDLRLEYFNKLVDYSYNDRIVASIAAYLQASFPDTNMHAHKLKALDFGCGSGLSLQLILKHFPQLDIVGVDISEKAVQRSHEQKLPVQLIRPDRPLPFETAHFDLIFAVFVMHFNIDIRTLAELRRILHPEGKYVFNLFQRNIDGVKQQLIEAGFQTVEIVNTLSEKGTKHWIVSCGEYVP